MTKHSFKQQYNEPNEYYDYFKIYLKQGKNRSVEKTYSALLAEEDAKATDNPAVEYTVTIEKLTKISDRWKWINRAIDYDYYQNLLLHHRQSLQRLDDLNKRLKYLQDVAINTTKDNSIPIKDKMAILEKLSKTETICTSERYKTYQKIKKFNAEMKEYEKNKYNVEAEKQKDLLIALNDYENGFISDTEYAIITRDYPEEIVEKIEKQQKNPMDIINKLTNPMNEC